MKYGTARTFTCPKCYGNTKVLDSRLAKRAAPEEIAIRRCRECKECGHRVYTIEKIHRERED